jgi:glycosyltransferase involved in cell wall biosynthesis
MYTDFPHYEGLTYRVQALTSNFQSLYRITSTVFCPIIEGTRRTNNANEEIIRFNFSMFRTLRYKSRFLFWLLFNALFLLQLLLRYRQFYGKYHYIQIEQEHVLIPGVLFGKILKRPTVLDDAHLYDFKRELGAIGRVLPRVVQMFLQQVKLIIFASERTANLFQASFPGINTSVYVVDNGINVDNALVSTNERSNTGYSRAQPVRLLFIGTMAFKPNRDAAAYCIKIVTELKKRGVPIELNIIGGPLEALQTEGLPYLYRDREEIKFLGYVTEERKQYYLQNSDICLNPFFVKHKGGTHIKVLEYLAYGKTVISTNEGIFGIAGLRNRQHVVTADTIPEFATIIEDYAHDNTQYLKMGEQAQEFILKNHTWPAKVRQFHDILTENVLI